MNSTRDRVHDLCLVEFMNDVRGPQAHADDQVRISAHPSDDVLTGFEADASFSNPDVILD